MIDIIKTCLRQSNSNTSLEIYKNLILTRLQEEGFDFEDEEARFKFNIKTIDIIAASVFGRREELR